MDIFIVSIFSLTIVINNFFFLFSKEALLWIIEHVSIWFEYFFLQNNFNALLCKLHHTSGIRIALGRRKGCVHGCWIFEAPPIWGRDEIKFIHANLSIYVFSLFWSALSRMLWKWFCRLFFKNKQVIYFFKWTLSNILEILNFPISGWWQKRKYDLLQFLYFLLAAPGNVLLLGI